MSQFKNREEAEAAGVYIRKVQSFVKREGRLTNAQARAIEQNWASMGLDHQKEHLDCNLTFGREAPLVLEIGFGMGQSLLDMAQSDPASDFIGIEVHKPGVGACLAEAQERGIKNLRVFEHDAVEVLSDCITDNSLSRVQLYFPDPWHKKRHHKRRLVQPEFVQDLRQKLLVGGGFHMATDWEHYAQHMREVMSQAEGFVNQSENSTYVPRPDYRPITKFEKRGERLGHGVWDLLFERTA